MSLNYFEIGALYLNTGKYVGFNHANPRMDRSVNKIETIHGEVVTVAKNQTYLCIGSNDANFDQQLTVAILLTQTVDGKTVEVWYWDDHNANEQFVNLETSSHE